jgi:hypothetical protein
MSWNNPEPIAAALAYGLHEEANLSDEMIMVRFGWRNF